MSAYKNIIFDLGGVMVDFDPNEYLMEMFHDPVIERKLYGMTFGSEEWQLVDKGDITRFAADSAMLERTRICGLGFEGQEIVDHWPNILRTRRSTVDIAAQLKAQGFSIYCLSNIAQDTAVLLQRRNFWEIFDGAVLSCEVHMLKPQPEIYQTLLEKYQLKAEECIFIDDNQKNVDAANALGIHAITMTKDPADLVNALEDEDIHVVVVD